MTDKRKELRELLSSFGYHFSYRDTHECDRYESAILAMFDEMEREADEISSELCEPVKCEFCETWLPTHPLQNAKHLRQRIAELVSLLREASGYVIPSDGYCQCCRANLSECKDSCITRRIESALK